MPSDNKRRKTQDVKREKFFRWLLFFSSILIIILASIPWGYIGTAKTKLGDKGLLNKGLFEYFWLSQSFDALETSYWITIIFIIIAMFIYRPDKIDHCYDDYFQEKVNALKRCILPRVCHSASLESDWWKTVERALVFGFVLFIFISLIVQITLGAYIKSYGVNGSVQIRWQEDSNYAESLRSRVILAEQCCGWDDIFQYQLMPACNRQQLLQRPKTCSAALDEIIDDYLRPVGDSAVAIGVLLIIPWISVVALYACFKEQEGANFWKF